MATDPHDPLKSEGFNIDTLPRWLRDRIELVHEMAGVETGRARRFLTSNQFDARDPEKREKDKAFNALMRMLMDPDYARLYSLAADTVTRAEDAAERAMRKLTEQAEEAGEHLEAMRASAAQVAGGRKVFKSASGRIYAEDGSDVTDQAASITGLTPSSPDWEEFKEARDRLKRIEQQRREVENYRRDVLEPIKERLSDTDNPYSKTELREIKETIRQTMPDVVRPEYEAPEAAALPVIQAAADDYGDTASLSAPGLAGNFKTAHDEPYGSSATKLPTIAPKPR